MLTLGCAAITFYVFLLTQFSRSEVLGLNRVSSLTKASTPLARSRRAHPHGENIDLLSLAHLISCAGDPAFHLLPWQHKWAKQGQQPLWASGAAAR